MTASGISTSVRFVSAASMNGPDGFNPRGGDSDESERMEAAGVMAAQSGAHNALENAHTAFPTAPTRINVIMLRYRKCYLCPRTDQLPRSPAGQILNPESLIGTRSSSNP